jgi:hypothetical protein
MVNSQDALFAIEFAIAPEIPALGKLRESKGPSGTIFPSVYRDWKWELRYVYVRRYDCLRKGYHKVYPRVTVIGNVITDRPERVGRV